MSFCRSQRKIPAGVVRPQEGEEGKTNPLHFPDFCHVPWHHNPCIGRQGSQATVHSWLLYLLSLNPYTCISTKNSKASVLLAWLYRRGHSSILLTSMTSLPTFTWEIAVLVMWSVCCLKAALCSVALLFGCQAAAGAHSTLTLALHRAC